MYVGVRAGGGIGDEIEDPAGDPYEMYRIVFDITFFFFVIVILLAIIQGMVDNHVMCEQGLIVLVLFIFLHQWQLLYKKVYVFVYLTPTQIDKDLALSKGKDRARYSETKLENSYGRPPYSIPHSELKISFSFGFLTPFRRLVRDTKYFLFAGMSNNEFILHHARWTLIPAIHCNQILKG